MLLNYTKIQFLSFTSINIKVNFDGFRRKLRWPYLCLSFYQKCYNNYALYREEEAVSLNMQLKSIIATENICLFCGRFPFDWTSSCRRLPFYWGSFLPVKYWRYCCWFSSPFTPRKCRKILNAMAWNVSSKLVCFVTWKCLPISLRIATIHFRNNFFSSGNVWKEIFTPFST